VATFRVFIFFILLSGMIGSVNAQSFDFNLSDESAEAKLMLPLGFGSLGQSQWDISLLYKDSDSGKDDNLVGGLGFEVVGEAGSDAPGLEFGVGMKGYYGEADEDDIGAFTLGGMLRYSPPSLSRFFGIARLNYAPKIVSFRDAERFWAVEARMGYEILPTAEIYIGYRDVEAKIEDKNSDVEVAKGAYIGVTFHF